MFNALKAIQEAKQALWNTDIDNPPEDDDRVLPKNQFYFTMEIYEARYMGYLIATLLRHHIPKSIMAA